MPEPEIEKTKTDNKIIILPIGNKFHKPYGEEVYWYKICKITDAKIAFIRDIEDGTSWIDLDYTVIGFLSEENAKKYNLSVGKLDPFRKIKNDNTVPNMLYKDNRNVLQSIEFSYENSQQLLNVELGSTDSERIKYSPRIDNVLKTINPEIFNILYVPHTCCNRKSKKIEDAIEDFIEPFDIKKTNYALSARKYIISNKEQNEIKLNDDILKLKLIYNCTFEDSMLPDCFIYEITEDTQISFKNIKQYT